MAPKSTPGRIAAVAYVLACAGVIAIAISGREYRDTDIVVAYAMLFLAFPTAYVVAIIFGLIAQTLYQSFGVIVPGGLIPNILTIILIGSIGYAQWFLFLPWLWRRIRGAI